MSAKDFNSFTRSSFKPRREPPAVPFPREVAPLGGYDQSNEVQRTYKRKVQKILSIDLGSARTDAEFKVSGNCLLYRDSTNAGDRLSIKMTDEDDRIPWRPGDGELGIPFTRLLITNTVQAGATATLVYFTASPDEDVRVI